MVLPRYTLRHAMMAIDMLRHAAAYADAPMS